MFRCPSGVFVVALAIGLCLAAPLAAQQPAGDLFPFIAPFQTGFLDVGQGHQLYFELSGNPEGKPVIVLHGGPGAGCYPRMRRYFDPTKYLIVLFDQRGAGQSIPQGKLEGNDTWNLVDDIEKIREHLKIDRFLLFGGSWGTTLGLAYAEKHPTRVSGLILRGVFLGTEEEILSHYQGTSHFFPEEHARLLALLPDQNRGTHPDYLAELIQGDDRQLGRQVMEALGRFELKFMKLYLDDRTVQGVLASMTPEQHYRYVCLDLHYVTHRYFLEPGQLLRDAGALADIPAIIINGRYDMACPPLFAYRLHKALPKSELIIVERAGHSETEEEITRELVKAAAEFQ